ncbi:MAG TPA: GlsB/YeaQ/YmgE family stress response membrane protein [Roseiflexaceae bacterium]|nr:GlsB/YeaQ/YmgE family stress response membrane protein [Roseiflexaceae bacterium]
MINFILWLLFGALVGWLASIVMRTDAQQGALMNIVVGIVGAFLGGFLFSLFTGNDVSVSNSVFDLSSLLVAFIGAVVLLGIINLFTRGRAR